MSRQVRTSLWILVATFWASPSFAYILDPEFIVKEMVKARIEANVIDHLTVEGDLSFGSPAQNTSFDAVVYLSRPGCMRLVEKQSRQTWLRCGNRIATGQDDQLNLSDSEPVDLLAPLLYPERNVDRASERIWRWLLTYQIDTTVVSLSRLDGVPCYVIGARPWEQEKAQVWIYKDSLLPAKWMYDQGAQTSRRPHWVEIIYRNYNHPELGRKFPTSIEYIKDGEHQLTLTDLHLTSETRLPKTLFKLPGSS